MKLKQHEIKNFQQKIRDFYKDNRRDLPWRHTTNPYHILVSEIMLQQTQVSRVLQKYKEFCKTFPTFNSLAKASLKEVLQVWQGLGYNRRALYLKQTAEKIVKEHKGNLPNNPKILETFKGIGHATARSIAVFAFNKPEVFIETNVRRVYIHEFFSDLSSRGSSALQNDRGDLLKIASPAAPDRNDNIKISDTQLYLLIEQTLDRTNPREWYYALMDYGSHLVKQVINPNRKSAHYVKQSKFEGSLRQVRGKIVKALLLKKMQTTQQLEYTVETSKDQFHKALSQLIEEKFLEKKGKLIQLKS